MAFVTSVHPATAPAETEYGWTYLTVRGSLPCTVSVARIVHLPPPNELKSNSSKVACARGASGTASPDSANSKFAAASRRDAKGVLPGPYTGKLNLHMSMATLFLDVS